MRAISIWKAMAVAVLLVSCLPVKSFAQQGDAFAQANQEYAAGHFPEAIELYEGLARAGEFSAALFYDLGNASYRAGDLGRAILNYERGLALEPHHPEVAANLRLVRDKAHALELKKTWLDRATSPATTNQYSIAAAIGFWAAVFALAGLLLASRRSIARAALLALSLLLLGACGVALYAVENGPSGAALAIVTAKSTEARLATADSAGTVLVLPPGSEIKILSTRGDWVYAALPNDLRGWIPAQSAERVRL